MILRPMFKFFGSKWRASARHAPPLPGAPIIEPFAGSAGYSLRYGADRDVVLVERDPVVASIWRYLIDASPSEVLDLPDLPAGGSVEDLDVPDPVKALVGFWLNSGTATPRKTAASWSRMFAEKDQVGGWSHATRARIAAQVPFIRKWAILERSWEDLPNPRATWFVDPPYAGAVGRHYACGSDGIDFEALAAFCRSRRGLVIACEQEGAKWLPFEPFELARGSFGSRVSSEVLWTQEKP